MARAQQTRFQPVVLPQRRSGRNRFRVGRRIIYWTLAVVVGLDALLLLLGPDGALWRRAAKSDITQQVSVTIQEINPKTNTIRVVGDLVGIMGMDVVVPPQTWIGIDRQLVVFGQLRDGLRANISFVRHGEQRVARWIAATSAKVSEIKPTEAGAAPVATPVGASSPAR